MANFNTSNKRLTNLDVTISAIPGYLMVDSSGNITTTSSLSINPLKIGDCTLTYNDTDKSLDITFA